MSEGTAVIAHCGLTALPVGFGVWGGGPFGVFANDGGTVCDRAFEAACRPGVQRALAAAAARGSAGVVCLRASGGATAGRATGLPGGDSPMIPSLISLSHYLGWRSVTINFGTKAELPVSAVLDRLGQWGRRGPGRAAEPPQLVMWGPLGGARTSAVRARLGRVVAKNAPNAAAAAAAPPPPPPPTFHALALICDDDVDDTELGISPVFRFDEPAADGPAATPGEGAVAELSQLRMSEMTELRATCPEVEKFGAILRIEIPPGASDASSSEVKPEVTHEVKPEVRVRLPADYPRTAPALHRLIGRHGCPPATAAEKLAALCAAAPGQPVLAQFVAWIAASVQAGAQALEAEIEGIQAAHPVWRRVDRGGGTVLRIDIPGQKRGGMSPWIELILPETYPGWSLWHARFKPEIKSHGRKEVEAQAKLDAMMAATPWGQPVLAPYVAWVVRKARVVHEVKISWRLPLDVRV